MYRHTQKLNHWDQVELLVELKLNFSYRSMKSYLPPAPARIKDALLKTLKNSMTALFGQFKPLTPSLQVSEVTLV